jgi:signal transduction histidine kinase
MLVAERSLPVLWAAVPALAAALAQGLAAGLVAAGILIATTALVRSAVTGTVVANGVLLVFSVLVLGWVADLARSAERERVLAEEVRAREAERRRIGRIVHDGVLQVLAQVAHRAPELGPDGQALAAEAAEQEIALRRLVAGDETTVVAGEVDLASVVAALASPVTTVSPPAEPVLVDAELASELDAAVRAAVDNVRRHAPGAHAWVLLEDDVDDVRIIVRDDGPGFVPSRLDEAIAEGRLGVAESICGRLSDLGGRASVRSTPGAGVVVELVAPRSRRG